MARDYVVNSEQTFLAPERFFRSPGYRVDLGTLLM